MLIHLGQQRRIVRRINNHRDEIMVLGGSADHSRAADIDILDTLIEAGAARQCLLERVEV